MGNKGCGNKRCMELYQAVEDLAVVEQRPSMEGRQMFMILGPKKSK